jgi:hypothetical protein
MLNAAVNAKKTLIQSWKTGRVTGSMFNRNLRMDGQEIGLKFYQGSTEIYSETLQESIMKRVWLKLYSQCQPSDRIHLMDRINLMDYTVYFFKQNSYAEYADRCTAQEVFKIIIHERGLNLKSNLEY